MRGGTDLINYFIQQEINVVFLCSSQPQKVEMWHRARDYYEGEYKYQKGRTFTMVFNNNTILRLLHLQNENQNEKILCGFHGVIIVHPDIIFIHKKDEQLYDLIEHKNQRHKVNVPT